MRLHPIQHDVKGILWCGLAAYSLLTGLPTSSCKEAIRSYLAKNNYILLSRRIKGIYCHELVDALKQVGYSCELLDFQNSFYGSATAKPYFATFLQDLGHYFSEEDCALILVEGHYVCLHQGFIWDNFRPNGSRTHPFALTRPVVAVWQVQQPKDF